MTTQIDLHELERKAHRRRQAAGAEEAMIDTRPARERPILFSGAMIPPILEDRKLQTRRIMTPQPEHLQRHEWRGKLVYEGEHRLWCWRDRTFENLWDEYLRDADRRELAKLSPYGVPGDRLWVKETHAQFAVGNRTGTSPQCVAYRATCADDGSFDYVNNGDEIMRLKVTKWTPAIFMPRWASRITLEVVESRVQCLHEISEDDARAEGVSIGGHPHHRSAFAELWESINGKRAPWSSNPWVWCISFRRIP